MRGLAILLGVVVACVRAPIRYEEAIDSVEEIGEGRWHLALSGDSRTNKATLTAWFYRKAGQLCGKGNYEVDGFEAEIVDRGVSTSEQRFGAYGSSASSSTWEIFGVSGVVRCLDLSIIPPPPKTPRQRGRP